MEPIGYVVWNDLPGTGVHRECASIADRDGYPIRTTDGGKYTCEACGRRIGKQPKRSHVSNPYR